MLGVTYELICYAIPNRTLSASVDMFLPVTHITDSNQSDAPNVAYTRTIPL